MSANKPSLVNLAIRLALFAAIAAIVLAVTDRLTLPARIATQEGVENNAIKLVLPDFERTSSTFYINEKGEPCFEKPFDNACAFTPAWNQNKLVGFACKGTSNKAYAGNLTVMFGLEIDGTVGVVSVIAHNETPGLGTIETNRQKQKTIYNLLDTDTEKVVPNAYLDQFNGKKITSIEESFAWKIKKDGGSFEFKGGATMSMRAITDAVYETARTFIANKESIIQFIQKENPNMEIQ